MDCVYNYIDLTNNKKCHLFGINYGIAYIGYEDESVGYLGMDNVVSINSKEAKEYHRKIKLKDVLGS